ncbi:MAG: hypothetical protein BWY88_00872 [Synergistetes bacterium ADurb.Bin520]|nr:MAG: hypothetical protein BWY88_00872 [Synergistetes bacterium ADurb.Bin520]
MGSTASTSRTAPSRRRTTGASLAEGAAAWFFWGYFREMETPERASCSFCTASTTLRTSSRGTPGSTRQSKQKTSLPGTVLMLATFWARRVGSKVDSAGLKRSFVSGKASCKARSSATEKALAARQALFPLEGRLAWTWTPSTVNSIHRMDFSATWMKLPSSLPPSGTTSRSSGEKSFWPMRYWMPKVLPISSSATKAKQTSRSGTRFSRRRASRA